MDKDCLFCKIIHTGEIPATKLYEDEYSYAFLDINPDSYGHTLLVPKKHTRNIFDIDEKTLASLASPLIKISQAIKKGLGASGLKITMNNEPAGGQLVFHSHIHIIPFYEEALHKLGVYKDGEIDNVAQKIKHALT
ncbi:MAG: HIT family protein [Candidatus Paceibacterota bacterium]